MCCTERTPKSSSGRIMSARQVRHNTRQKKKTKQKEETRIKDRGSRTGSKCCMQIGSNYIEIAPRSRSRPGLQFCAPDQLRSIFINFACCLLVFFMSCFGWVVGGYWVYSGVHIWRNVAGNPLRTHELKGQKRCNFGVLRIKFDYSVQVEFISNL